MKRRSLVLTNEAARHPFRQIMPVVRRPFPSTAPQSMDDTKFFVLTFSAAFLAFYGFLS